MSKLRELFSDTLIYGVSSVFARFINYLLVPLYTGVFTPGEYGVVGLVYAAIGLLNVIFTMGMESAYLRYGKDREQAKDLFKTQQLFLLGASFIFVLVLWLMEPLLQERLSLGGNEEIYLMMLGILVMDTLGIVPFAELRLVQRAWLFALLKTGNVIINLALNLYLILVLNFGIEAVFISNLAASAITTLAVSMFTLPMYSGGWNTNLIQKALKFGLPFIPAGIGYVINESLDRFFLQSMSPSAVTEIYGPSFTPEDIVGIYNACYKLAVFMLLFVQMFRMAWQPFFMRYSDDSEAPSLFSSGFRYFNLGAGIIFLGVALFADQIVAIRIPGTSATLIDSAYWSGLSIVPVLLAAYWFQGWYVNFSAGIFIKEQTKLLPQITIIGAMITIITNMVLVPRFGMMGSAWATVVSYGVMALLLYIYSTKTYKVPYSIREALFIMLVAVGSFLLKPQVVRILTSELAAEIVLFIIGSIIITGITIINRPKNQS